MIQPEEWIEARLFQFALARYATALPFEAPVGRVWKMPLDVGPIMRIFVRFDVCIRTNETSHLGKEVGPGLSATVFPASVLLTGPRREWTVRGHLSNAKSQDPTGWELDHQRHRKRLTLRVLERLKIIKFDDFCHRTTTAEHRIDLQSDHSQKEKFPNDRFAIHTKIESNAPLRHRSREEAKYEWIEVTTFLPKANVPRRD